MELDEVVMKLIGPVEAVGEHHEDTKRLANMKALTLLADRLIWKISAAASDADREEDSMRAIGTHAKDFLRELRVELPL